MSFLLHRTGLGAYVPPLSADPALPFVEDFSWATDSAVALSTRPEWVVGVGELEVRARDFGGTVGKLAYAATHSSVCEAIYDEIALPPDQYMQVDLVNFSQRVVIRLRHRDNQGDHECYQFRIDRSSSSWAIQRRLGGGWTTLGSGSATLPVTCAFRAEVEGSSLRMFANGSQIGSTISDGALAEGTRTSFILIGANPSTDNTRAARVEIGTLI